MQQPALEVDNHQVISWSMIQSLGDLCLKSFVSSFEDINMVWFRHDIPKHVRKVARKKRAALYGKVEESLGDIPQTLPGDVRSSCASIKPKLLAHQASLMLK
jgi:hypothetical protein